MTKEYGVTDVDFTPLAGISAYKLLDSGEVLAAASSRRIRRCSRRKYVVLKDPKNIFGFQHVAPIVLEEARLPSTEPFTPTLNTVSSAADPEGDARDEHGRVSIRSRPRPSPTPSSRRTASSNNREFGRRGARVVAAVTGQSDPTSQATPRSSSAYVMPTRRIPRSPGSSCTRRGLPDVDPCGLELGVLVERVQRLVAARSPTA